MMTKVAVPPAKKATSISAPAKKLELYDALLAGFKDVERKGDKMQYTAHNGNMFSFLNSEGEFALRLCEEDRKNFIAKYNTCLFETLGTTLKEFVHVPATLFSQTTELRKYMVMSFAYAKTLKKKQ